jgi:hypothetical protein
MFYLEEDIKCTNRALKNQKLDYLTKREYQNDLIQDRKELHIAHAQLGQLLAFMCENGMIDELQRLEPTGKSK